MDLSTDVKNDVLFVTVEESRIDAAGALEFKEDMRKLAADAPPRVVLDLGKVTFLDSSGLGALVAVLKLMAPEAKLELAQLGGAVAQVMKLTRMDKVFTIHPTSDAALASTSAI
ncbi:MAG: STAS domain-containing protein [Pseudoruegeria sp.]